MVLFIVTGVVPVNTLVAFIAVLTAAGVVKYVPQALPPFAVVGARADHPWNVKPCLAVGFGGIPVTAALTVTELDVPAVAP